MSFSLPILSVPRQRLRAALGEPEKRLLWMVMLTGFLGGLVGAAYLGLLKLFEHGLGPSRWSLTAHLAVLVTVGIAVAVLTRWLGDPAEVELLVDNIHVLG